MLYLLTTAAALAVTPADELAAVLTDARKLPPHACRDTRWISLAAVPHRQQAEAAAVISFVLNSVSRSPRLARPEIVPGSGGRLLRLRLGDYELPAALWEAMLRDEPFWHLRARVRTGGAAAEVITDGGWVGLEAAAALRALTHSAGALVRGDWWVVRATTTEPDGFYYTLAGVPPSEDEFLRGLGVDVQRIGQLQADRGANLIDSGVTRKLRRVVRRQGPLGGVWQTYDPAANTPERDPIRNPFGFVFDAGETIAARANGLHVFALFDRQGRRQDSVPDRIAKDLADAAGPGIIRPLVSCVRCHVEDGLRDVTNDQAALMARGIRHRADRAADVARLESFYGADLERHLRRDREDYAAAVAAATGGLSPRDVAAGLARLIHEYQDRLVTLRQAARELGAEPAELAVRLSYSVDPVLLALAAGLPVQRQQWESSFAEAALATAPATQP